MDVREDAFAAEDLEQSLASGRDRMQHMAVLQGRAVQCRVLVPLHIS